jgi:leucyl-tRNA synthetase
LRFTDPKNTQAIFGPEAASWLPVDLYVGGQEHAVLHLLYARFWHKVLYDIGVVDHPEPFTKLIHQGMILGSDGEKMSKSRGNVINPDDVVKEHGADALRLYEMFMGPLEATKPWQTGQLMGVVRFRDRVYSLVQPGRLTDQPPSGEIVSELHKTIKKVTHDIEKLSFNTAISSMMILANKLAAMEASKLPKKAVETLVLLLSPFAPHVAEEMWAILGHKKSLAYEPWPVFDEKLTEDVVVKLAVQVNGKVRATIEVSKESAEDDVRNMAMAQASVVKFVQDKTVKKIIYIPGRILNIIV